MGNTCEHDPITSTAYMLKTKDYDMIFSMTSVTGFKVCDLAVEARERREEGRSDPWMCHCDTKMLGIQGDSKIENIREYLEAPSFW